MERATNIHLFWNFPQALHTAEQVAAPQHEVATVTSCWGQYQDHSQEYANNVLYRRLEPP